MEPIRDFFTKARIRQAIAMSLTALIIYETVTGKIEALAIVGIYGTVLGFYFGEGD